MTFEWDESKERTNIAKHGVDFSQAMKAFFDVHRVIQQDVQHSQHEPRWHCLGQVDGHVLTVRFTVRGDVIRIIGAGYWRKGKQIYEETHRLRGLNGN